jgi:hypothetical protein
VRKPWGDTILTKPNSLMHFIGMNASLISRFSLRGRRLPPASPQISGQVTRNAVFDGSRVFDESALSSFPSFISDKRDSRSIMARKLQETWRRNHAVLRQFWEIVGLFPDDFPDSHLYKIGIGTHKSEFYEIVVAVMPLFNPATTINSQGMLNDLHELLLRPSLVQVSQMRYLGFPASKLSAFKAKLIWRLALNHSTVREKEWMQRPIESDLLCLARIYGVAIDMSDTNSSLVLKLDNAKRKAARNVVLLIEPLIDFLRCVQRGDFESSSVPAMDIAFVFDMCSAHVLAHNRVIERDLIKLLAGLPALLKARAVLDTEPLNTQFLAQELANFKKLRS